MWSVLTRLLEVQVPRRGEYSAQFTEVGVSGCLRKKRINGIRMVCMTENHRNPGTHDPGTHGFLDLDRILQGRTLESVVMIAHPRSQVDRSDR